MAKIEGISPNSDIQDWQTNASKGNSEGAHAGGAPGVSEDISRIKSGDIQDWQCYPSTATQAEDDGSRPGRGDMSFTPNVDGHRSSGYEQKEVTDSPNTQDIPYGPKPPKAAR